MVENAEEKTVMEEKEKLETGTPETLKMDSDADNLGAADNISTQNVGAQMEPNLNPTKQEDVNLKNLNLQEPPMEFRCPISGCLMENPVVVQSGLTFEASSIQWIKDNHQKCPARSDLLPSAVLTPNHLLKEMIDHWRQGKLDFAGPSRPKNQERVRKDSKEHLVSLLKKLPGWFASDESDVLKELRFLTTEKFPNVRALFGEIKGAIDKLLNLTTISRAYGDTCLQDDLVNIVMNISKCETNKRKIVAYPESMTFLIRCMRSQSMDTRRRAAAAVSALSTLDTNIREIGESGAMKPLVKLVEQGDKVAMHYANKAISNLCKMAENGGLAVSEGAVVAMVGKVISRVFVEEMLPILATLSSDERATKEMEENGMLPCLFMILRKEVSEESKEHCVSIIHAMCNDMILEKTRKINEVEKGRETLESISNSDTVKDEVRVKVDQLLLKLDWADMIPPSSE